MRRLILFLLLLSACKPKPLTHSFYYWKMGHEVDSNMKSRIDELGVNHFYVHILDVDWDPARKKPVPRSSTYTNDFNRLEAIPLTPVVFITNQVFEKCSKEDCEKLAKDIEDETFLLNKKMLKRFDFPELQIDCDWTASTKENYFHFLTVLRKRIKDKPLSVTIRLYPCKYPEKMGVPPVDKGVLMCYNLGTIKSPQTKNSIFDKAELDQYLTKKQYPLPLDIALPIFGWYVWSRNDQYKGIIYESPELVEQNGFESIQGNNFRVKTDTVVQNQYLRAGDVLRREYPEEEELIASAGKLLGEHEVHERIIFYHWDTQLIRKYEHVIKEVYGLR